MIFYLGSNGAYLRHVFKFLADPMFLEGNRHPREAGMTSLNKYYSNPNYSYPTTSTKRRQR